MRAILIDPYTKSISEISYDGTLESAYNLISCYTIQAVSIGHDHVVYVDEEGLLHEPKPFWQWQGAPNPIAGKGLIISIDSEGDDAPATVSLESIASRVTFPAVRFTGMTTSVDEQEGVTIVKTKANFEKLQ
jgi:hypothetical protein